MQFKFTKEMVEEILHTQDAGEWFDAMEELFPKYDITTIPRVAGFIAQTAHESNNYKVLSENLNYSAKALDAIFGKYFKRAGRDANEYHRKPEEIANVIYANRMDNGDTDSGDGWQFRGGGILQLTGRHNYTKFGDSVGMSAEEATDYVRTPRGAIESACWFWKTNKLNDICDDMDIVKMTKRINGGTIGLDDRKKHWNHALKVLGWDGVILDNVQPIEYGVIRRGSKGEQVKLVQEKLGLDADGIFGGGTEAAIVAWQKENDLVADGIIGPASMEVLLR